MIKKEKIRDINLYAFTSREVFLNFIENEQKILIAINAEKILKRNVKLHSIINKNIGYADGVGAVMALKNKGLTAVKIPGAEFWLDIVNKFQKQKSFYFIGASQEVIEKTIRKLREEYTSINIKGYRNGFINDSDKEKLIADVQLKKPDVVFVAQGSPRQEFLMEELQQKHPALYMGLGGSFDVYCGLKKRAPKLFLKANLEWFYRLLMEPTRIKRQLGYVYFYFLLKTKRL